MSKIKEYFSKKSDSEIFAILLFLSCVVIMTVLAIFRFCGIGYFANEYEEHALVPWLQELILFALKWWELAFILAILAKVKLRTAVLISLLYSNVYWLAFNNTMSFAFDVIYYLFVPFFVSKFEYKRIGYGVFLIAIVLLYQVLMMLARYEIDLNAKFNYIAMIESVFDYKIFIMSIYFLVLTRRLKNENDQHARPE